MDWKTIRAALDCALASNAAEVEVVFLGGEPLLEYPMIQRAVEYVERHRRQGKRIKYGISTNGTLMTDAMTGFLAGHRFDTQLSFDGIEGAQNLRAPGTFAVLDGLLDRLSGKHTDFFRRDLTITLTVTPSGVGSLADSIDYFLKKGIQKITVSPSIIHDPDWKVERIEEIDAQYERIFESSLQHLEQTGKIPVLIFSRKYGDSRCGGWEGPMCGIVRGEAVTVDVDGQVYGCTVLARSYQRFDSKLMQIHSDDICMGCIDDRAFSKRLESFPSASRRAEFFHHKEKKYSSYGRCGECPFIADCYVCPVSIVHVPGNGDPDRVSDFCCAFYLVSLKYRKRFPAQRSPWKVLQGTKDVCDDMKRWKELAGLLGS
jgi:sulfatase maturation enzyme AslB (radical SAM superfamily)